MPRRLDNEPRRWMSPKKREYLTTHSAEEWSSRGAGSSAEVPTNAMTSSQAEPEQLAIAKLANSRNRPMRRSCRQNDEVTNKGACGWQKVPRGPYAFLISEPAYCRGGHLAYR